MEKSIDYPSAKRLKITDEQSVCSTFECLPVELILNVFEYFNTKEIVKSFLNLNALITSCIFDRHQQVHVYLDQEMSSLSDRYSPDQVISLYMKCVIIPIDTFHNVKSISIVVGNASEDKCLNVINQICKLPHLINFKLSLSFHEATSIDHRIIDIALRYSSPQRIVLLRNSNLCFYSNHKYSLVKFIFPSKSVYKFGDSPDQGINYHSFGLVNDSIPLSITRRYHVRQLDLTFKSWRLPLLAKILSTMPLLITLKVKGHSCCNDIISWLWIKGWDELLQKLKALQKVDIDICLAIPIRSMRHSVAKFNKAAAEKFETCKRINLTAGRRTKEPGVGVVQISASLNLN